MDYVLNEVHLNTEIALKAPFEIIFLIIQEMLIYNGIMIFFFLKRINKR